MSLAVEALGEAGPATAGRPAFELTLVGTPDAESVSGTDREASAVVGPAAHRERDGLFAAALPGAGLVVADLAGAHGAAFLDLTAVQRGALRPGAADVLVAAPVWRFAASAGLVACHAAAALTPMGPVVLRGPSGSGKTTAVCALGLHGWPVLADEVVWVDPLGPQPVLRGGQPFVRPEADTLLHLAQLGDLVDEGRGNTVLLGHGGLPRTGVAPLGPIAFLGARRSSGPGSFRRITLVEGIARYEEASIAGERTQRPEALATARDTLLAQGTYEIRIGSLAHLPGLLMELVETARLDLASA
jgi:hypothetical protein